MSAARRSWPKVLAFDTSGPFIAIGTSTESYSGGEVHDLARGQAERLLPLLETRLAALGWAWSDIDAIGVCVGPGNFTGIRIAVAAARGLALGLGIPAIGVTAFEVAATGEAGLFNTAISLPAPKNQAYLQVFQDGAAKGPPRLIDPASPPSDLPLRPNALVEGHRASEIAVPFGARAEETSFAPRPALLAELAEAKFEAGASGRPAPLYVRPADAAPSRREAPKIIG